MIGMYGNCADVASAIKVFADVCTRSVFSWTAIIDAYFQKGCFGESLNLLTNMLAENVHSFPVLLNSCAGLSSVGYGDALRALIEKSGYKR